MLLNSTHMDTHQVAVMDLVLGSHVLELTRPE